jgi:predicted Zn-dependent protease
MTRREKLEAMLLKEPGDAFLHFGLAMEWVKLGMVEAALSSFDAVLRIDPDYTAAYYHKANALLSAQRPFEARKVLNAGIAAARRVGNGHAESEMQALLESTES